MEKECELYENTIPIYWQVIDNSNVMLHKLAMAMDGTVVSLKTDCVVVEDGIPVECIKGRGNYREERIPVDFSASPDFENRYSYELGKFEWTDATSRSRLITGRAGTGKSFMIKQEIRQLSSCKVLASTNKAAVLIGGETVHKHFGINNQWKSGQTSVTAGKQEYIFIDEVGILKCEVWELLYLTKKVSGLKTSLWEILSSCLQWKKSKSTTLGL